MRTRNDDETRASRRRLLAALVAGGLGVVSWRRASAQPAERAGWPRAPVRVVVPYAPGNISDSSARTISQELSKAVGQQFYVDNRAGANTQIGTGFVAKVASDGGTWLYTGPILTVMGALFKNLPFDPGKDLVPVSQAIANPLVFIVRPDFPARDIREFIALSRKQPGAYFVASGGIGTMPHMAHELLVASAGLQTQHVPYKGGSTFLADFMSGQITGVFDNPSSAIPLIRDGRAKALAVTSLQRSAALPDVPTVAELGVPGFEVMNWFGFFAPAGTSTPVIDRMNAQVAAVLRLPEIAQAFEKIGVTPVGSTRQRFAEVVTNDIAKWARIVRERNIKIE